MTSFVDTLPGQAALGSVQSTPPIAATCSAGLVLPLMCLHGTAHESMPCPGKNAAVDLVLIHARQTPGRFGLADGNAAPWFENVWRVGWTHHKSPGSEHRRSWPASDPLSSLLPPASLRLNEILQFYTKMDLEQLSRGSIVGKVEPRNDKWKEDGTEFEPDATPGSKTTMLFKKLQEYDGVERWLSEVEVLPHPTHPCY